MSKVTPDEYQVKHNQRTKAALDDIRRGVDAVTDSPTKLAAAKKDKMRANILASIDDGSWENGLNRVSLEEWKTLMRDKGVNNIPGGLDAAADKIRDFAADFLPFVYGVADKVKKMPDVTLEDNINKMVTQIRETAKYRRK